MNKNELKNVRQKTAEKYNIKSPVQKQGESDVAYYHRLAKIADQRLLRLEKLSQEAGYENVKKYSYARAMEDIKKYSGEGKNRFNTKAPTSKRQLQSKINAIKYFLESPTSTKKGIIKSYQSKADTINRKYGTIFTWEDLSIFFDRGYFDKLEREVSSSTMLYYIGKLQKVGIDVVNEIKNGNDNHKIISNDSMLDNQIKEWVKKYDIDWNDIIK